MKKLFFSLIAICMLSVSINAQTDSEEIAFMQTIFGMEKQKLVESFVHPSEDTSEAFWEIYDSYESNRKELGKKRLVLLQKYLDTYDKNTDEEVNALIKEMNSLGKSNDKLIDKYYKKLKKVNPVQAGAFYQIEGYIASKIRVEILENIPLFGEFE